MRAYTVSAISVILGATCALAAPGEGDETGAGGNLIRNGDFEAVTTERPPPGWTMWGAQAYKLPENYTRDQTVSHSGDASFRIHHPSQTSGYIVSSLDNAIRPKADQVYHVSFYARSDREGTAGFGLTAYETVQPFVDAPSPGRWPLDVGVDWKRFDFDVTEGWDFFADRSRTILLTFYPTLSNDEACTLWIDDVVVTEAPSPREGRLLDTSQLIYEPLQHRLQPGKSLEIIVDTERRLGPAARDVGAVSFHRVAGWTGHPYNQAGEYTLPPETERAIRDMRLPMTRFYAVGDEPFGLEASIDRAADMCRRIHVPASQCVLEFETQSARTKLAPEVWARGVAHARQQGYGFRYWEISNEPYLMSAGTAFPTPESYVSHVRAVSSAIRAVDPDAKIGIGINKDSQKWGNAILRQAAGYYDFVAAHHYAWVPDIQTSTFEAVALSATYRALETCLEVNALIHAYNPDRGVVQIDTEWGMHASGPNGEAADYVDRNANIFGTLHRAVRLIYYARENLVAGASSWQMLSRLNGQGFGVLAPEVPEKRCMLYWLMYYFNRHVGQWALDLEGTAPYTMPAAEGNATRENAANGGPTTPVLATLDENGTSLYLVIANGSWDTPTPCRIETRHIDIGRAEGILLTHSDPDGKPLLEQKDDAVSAFPVTVEKGVISCTIPAHAVVFLTLQATP